MALPLIQEATPESSQGRAEDARGIRRKELLSVHLSDELPSKMLPLWGMKQYGRMGWHGVPGHIHTYPLIQVGPRPDWSSLRPSRRPFLQRDADECTHLRRLHPATQSLLLPLAAPEEPVPGSFTLQRKPTRALMSPLPTHIAASLKQENVLS